MSRLFEELVLKRGFSPSFLNPKYEDLPSPKLLPDMEKAVSRIKKAVSSKEKVIIYGDYDADGVTASTVMLDALKLAGATEVQTMLPDRFLDGYGMSRRVVESAKKTGATLVITVDCGSANGEIIKELKEAGVETIVTDHHECPEIMPEAVAIVNPKRKDVAKVVPEFESHIEELMGLRELAGVGVAFMVARGMMEEGMIPEGQEKWMLDLVLIGTICDSMKMSEINRILCFYGVKVLKKTRRVGLLELMRTAGVKEITADAIGFQIGPRLNAAGRMTNAEVALRLLQEKSKVEAAKLAEEIERLNAERKRQQALAVDEVHERGVSEEPVLVTTGEWHEGVLGIIAGRLVEEYFRPTFVLSEVEKGILKGSGRSFGDFNLAEALKAVSSTIIGGGGHAGAAGVKLKREALETFKAQINDYYRSLGLSNQERFLEKRPDLEVRDVGEFTFEFLEELKMLEPFGVGNEVPIFEIPDALIVDTLTMGPEGKHLKLMIRGEDGKILKLIAFNVPKEWLEFRSGEKVDILVNIEENEWDGFKNIEGRILDLRGC
ncbi:single-stranded-DNA-specific exonuclease RecJ [Candidatus Saccharibacteria bacterium]|nr:single-stranded-DNA-specific exonuclease RecJ [Candidatus Saccharibacteria bacterium]